MARALHTLTEEETTLVNEFVEGGLAETHEEALQMLIDANAIQDTEDMGGNASFIPEGFTELKFHSGHQKSAFTKVDKMHKKAKTDSPFDIENWYLGAKFPKDEDKNIILNEVNAGYNLGMNPTIVVTHILYKGARFNPAEPSDTVETILGHSMFPSSQEEMIDKKSKKSLAKLRAELFAEYGGKDKVPNDKKIKFVAVVYGLAKTEDGWKPFEFDATIGKEEYNSVKTFIEDAQARQNSRNKFLSSKYLCEIDTQEDPNNDGNYFKIIKIKDELDTELRKELNPLIMSNMKAVSKFLAEQKESVKGNKDKEAPDEETEDENIDWD